MIDQETLEKIKKKQYLEGKDFPEELHRIIHEFYAGFDLDRKDNSYRKTYIENFIEDYEPFIVNYVTNIYDSNIRTTDRLSDELTFNRFLDTLSAYLTKYYENKKEEYHDDLK